MHSKDVLGRYGEQIAAHCLADAGLQILETNWRCARGEIDILARDGATLVICEVKTRSSVAFGDPAEAVSRAKSQRLRTLATMWLSGQSDHFDALRFDVVSVLTRANRPALVRHLRSAF
ncbi:MAG: putative endonuclease [Pseudonocardiales bacterium]|jgi:putative endonuclease|nr:putative endonuclease [Pseudonocardiales bacterium]